MEIEENVKLQRESYIRCKNNQRPSFFPPALNPSISVLMFRAWANKFILELKYIKYSLIQA